MNAGTGCPKTMYSTVQSTPPVALQFAGNPLQGCVVGTSSPRHADTGRSFFIATVFIAESLQAPSFATQLYKDFTGGILSCDLNCAPGFGVAPPPNDTAFSSDQSY